MKCPRCGHEMTLDTHRKYALNMCYECGYIEGRLIDPEKKGETNFERLKSSTSTRCSHFCPRVSVWTRKNLPTGWTTRSSDPRHRILHAAPDTGCGVFFYGGGETN